MSFFNPKEEVINIELTEYGKNLLSKGKFKPRYYSFFDDDILYDSRYANVSESQNYTVDRILYDTPYLKPQVYFSSREQNSKKLKEVSIKNADISVIDYDSKYMNNLCLGTSDNNSIFLPAWRLKFISGSTINNSSADNIVYNQDPLSTVINFDTASFKLFIADPADQDFLTFQENYKKSYLGLLTDSGETGVFSDQSELVLSIDVEERNVLSLKENFDIEVFLEETKTVEGITSNNWKQLYFLKKPTNIKKINENETILMDDYEYSDNFLPSLTEENVEWYFDIYVDNEVIVGAEGQINNIVYGDLYSSNIDETDKPFGDEC